MISLLCDLIFAGIAGYLAGRIMHTSFSTFKNVLLGLVGGFVGSLLFSLIGLSATNMFGGIFVSVVGACICIWLVRKFSK